MIPCSARRRAGWCPNPSRTAPRPSASAGSARALKAARPRPAIPSTPAVFKAPAPSSQPGAGTDDGGDLLRGQSAVVAVEGVFQATWLPPPDELPEVGQDQDIAQTPAQLVANRARTEQAHPQPPRHPPHHASPLALAPQH